MSRTLAEMRTLVQIILGNNPPARFTSQQIDEGLRAALAEYSEYRPLVTTEIIDGQDTYTITMASDFYAKHIIKVQLYDSDPDLCMDIAFYAYQQDQQWIIETRDYMVTSSQQVIIAYTSNHVIDGLDDAAGTSIPPQDEHLLATLAAAHAMRINAGVPLE